MENLPLETFPKYPDVPCLMIDFHLQQINV